MRNASCLALTLVLMLSARGVLMAQEKAAPRPAGRRAHGDSKTALAARVAREVNAFKGEYPLSGAPFAYYAVPALSPVKRLPTTFPEDGELCGPLRIVAARNEFEPASFVVFAFQNAEGATLKASPLAGRAGTIPAESIDLRIVKCWYQGGTAWYSYFADVTGREMVPELLLHDERLVRVDTKTKDNYLRVNYPDGADYLWISNRLAVDVPFNAETTPVADAKTIQPFKLTAGEFKQFWVTVKVPPDAAGGIYRGGIELSAAGRSAVIPLSVRVLPFELPKPMTNYDESREFYTMLYNGPNYLDIFRANGADKAHADKKMLAIYENMRDHNIRHPRLPDLRLTSRIAFIRENARNAFIRQLEILRDSGCSTDPLFGAIPAIPPYRWMTSVKNVPLSEQNPPPSLIKRIDEGYKIIRRMFGHGNVYCFGWDEPPRRLVVAERLPWKYIHDKGLKVFSTGKDSHLEYAGYNEDFINCPGEPTRERAAKWHAMGCRITNYAAPHTGPENPDFMRRVHGLQLFHANYDGIGNYKLSCSSWNDFLGEKYNFRRFNMTYPTRDGVIDTLAWEGVREAVDDVRYATRLKALARAAIATGKTENVYAGRRALQWLDQVDPKRVNLDTARLEMINRITALAEFENGIPKRLRPAARVAPALKEDAAVAEALVKAGERAAAGPRGVEKWEEILARKRVSRKQYAEATFKIIELRYAQGQAAEVQVAAEEAAVDARLTVGQRLTARLISAGIAATRKGADLKKEVAQAESAFTRDELTPEVKVNALNNAAKVFMRTRQYGLVREYSAMANALFRVEPRKVYECRYVEKAPSSVEGWLESPLFKDPKNRETRFVPYNRKAAELLIADVNAERSVGDSKEDADKKTAFVMAFDADGWSMFVACEDSEAAKVGAGLVRGGQLEMFFSPGLGECYIQWMVRFPEADPSWYDWDVPHRGFRSMRDYGKCESAVLDKSLGAYVFIPWESVYDKLPADGDTWPFNVIRWSRSGGVTWSGKVHAIHDFGVVKWSGLTPARLLAIKRKLVMKGFARYLRLRREQVTFWQDEVLGDPEFFKEALRPVVERLDRMGKKVDDTMTPGDVATLFERAVPDWMEFDHLVDELRRDYLARRLSADATR